MSDAKNDATETFGLVSCPACIRQYEVNTSASGKLAQCYMCGAYFLLGLQELRHDGNPAIVLKKPLHRRTDFLREGCAELVEGACTVLRLAGEPVTPNSIIEFIRFAPWDLSAIDNPAWRNGYFHRTMMKADSVSKEGSDIHQFRLLCGYFTGRLPGLSRSNQDMLLGAVTGVLESVKLDNPAPGLRPKSRLRRMLGL